MAPVHAITILEVLAVLVVLFLAGALATRGQDVLVDAPADAADLDLPAGPLQPEDVRRVRFGMAVRGYRMREVDEVLARLAADLAARDERLMALEQALVEVVTPHVEEAERSLSSPAQDLEVEPLSEPERMPVAEPAADPGPVPHVEVPHVEPERELPHALVVPEPGPVPMDPTSLVPRPLAVPEPVAPSPAESEPVEAALEPAEPEPSEPTPLEPAPLEPAGPSERRPFEPTPFDPDTFEPGRQTPEIHEPPPLWPQPDLEPEPEPMPPAGQPAEPDPLEPPADDSAFSTWGDDGFPDVQQGDREP